MRLSTRQLEAFTTVAKTLNFTVAAKRLNITQSALSQRIRKLEDELGTALLIRAPRGVRLTETGRRILRFCQARESLEAEIYADLATGGSSEMAGIIRLGAYSSIMRPVLIPALAPFLRANPKVQCELINAEAKYMPGFLTRGEADIIISDQKLDWAAVTSTIIGSETFVAIKSSRYDTRQGVYLDLAPEDRVTEEFFQSQNSPAPKYTRSFLFDVFGIIDGVGQGMGKAIISKHLIDGLDTVVIDESFEPITVDLYMHYYTQPYYTLLHEKVVQILKGLCTS